jgi:phosphate transport system substrate-binding protein
MGEIKSWDDPQIQKLNPGQHLPTLTITPIYRTGNSGTTYNFTDFLASTSAEWTAKLGVGQAVAWPTGIGVSGSAGVAGAIQNTPGAIGYVDTAFAVANHLHFAAIQNAANKFIFPSIRNVAAAGSAVKDVSETNEIHIVNPPKTNPTAYPISTFTYVIVPTSSKNGAALRKMIFWALTQGQAAKYTAKLWFAPIPKVVLVAAEKTLKQVKQST